jgi:antitoxin HicB
MSKKSVEEYLELPYTIEVVRDSNPENPGWVARVAELPGCITQGDDFAELGEMVLDAMRSWIEVALEDGVEVPEPKGEDEFSGKFIVRVPRSLHQRLVMKAQREDISLNQYVSTVLAGAVFGGGEDSFSAGEEVLKRVVKEAVREALKDEVM